MRRDEFVCKGSVFRVGVSKSSDLDRGQCDVLCKLAGFGFKSNLPRMCPRLSKAATAVGQTPLRNLSIKYLNAK